MLFFQTYIALHNHYSPREDWHESRGKYDRNLEYLALTNRPNSVVLSKELFRFSLSNFFFFSSPYSTSLNIHILLGQNLAYHKVGLKCCIIVVFFFLFIFYRNIHWYDTNHTRCPMYTLLLKFQSSWISCNLGEIRRICGTACACCSRPCVIACVTCVACYWKRGKEMLRGSRCMYHL